MVGAVSQANAGEFEDECEGKLRYWIPVPPGLGVTAPP